MAKGVTIKLEGDKELKRKLDLLGRRARGALLKAAEAGAEVIENAAEQRAPGPHIVIGNQKIDGGRAEVDIHGNEAENPLIYYDGYEVTEINHPLLSTYLIDSESNLWLGSEVNLHKLLSTAFSYMSEDEGLPKNTWAIARDRHGHIWFGSLSGELLEYDGKRLVKRNDYLKVFPGGLSFFKGSTTASDGTVYFSAKEGVLVWDGYSFSKIEGIPYESQICIIYEDPVDKSLLFGAGNGLYHLKNGRMNHYPDFVVKGHGIVEGMVREAEDSYWLSAGRGVVFLDRGNATRIRDTLVSSGYNFTMVRDGKGGVWVTSEEGLFFKRGSSTVFAHGLPESINTSANSIIMMDSSRILVGRMTDICIIDLGKFYSGEAGYYRLYDATDGFTGNDCLDNGIVRGSDGRFWIMASGRVIILDEKKLRGNVHPPRITLTDVEFETDSLTWESLKIPGLFYGRQGPVSLENWQNNLKFSYTGISTTNPVKVRYQHRLAGQECERVADTRKDDEAFQRMISIGAAADDTQRQVDLGGRLLDQRRHTCRHTGTHANEQTRRLTASRR